MTEFHKYPKIYAIGKEENQDIFKDDDEEIIIQEKVDGTNIRFMFKDGKIIFGSRTQQLTSNEGEDANVGKQFRVIVDYIRNKIAEDVLKKLEGHIFYGEGMIKHTMSYDWETIPRFLGFDIMDLESGKFIHWGFVKEMYRLLDLETVPLIDIKSSEQCREWKLDDTQVPVTKYPPRSDPNLKAEGIVLKNYSKQIFAKYVREQFKEENAVVFGGSPKYEETDDGKITARYCTNARIDKHIFKLVDDGHKLELAMMKLLPKLIYEDIWEENWRTIIKKYEAIHPRQMRKIITKRCLAVLKQVITNNELKSQDVQKSK